MRDLEGTVENHYLRESLDESIRDGLRKAGKRAEAFSVDDLAPVDEFHIRGREATEELLEDLPLDEETNVLDVGCGLGGTARFIASTYGSSVVGLDLSTEYCRLATDFTKQLDLDHRVRFQQGNALDMPFEDETFGVVLSEHVQMNIENKVAYVKEMARVLKPDGHLALYEICNAFEEDPYFPVPWADDSSISFLVQPEELRRLLEDAGLRVSRWDDVTPQSQAWFEAVVERVQQEGPPPVGLHLLMGEGAPERMKNVARNLAEGRIAVVQAVARKPPDVSTSTK